jgi:hypothetical protein
MAAVNCTADIRNQAALPAIGVETTIREHEHASASSPLLEAVHATLSL